MKTPYFHQARERSGQCYETVSEMSSNSFDQGVSPARVIKYNIVVIMISLFFLVCFFAYHLITHYNSDKPIARVVLLFITVIYISVMWNADIQLKWRCDHRSCDCDDHNCDDHIFISFVCSHNTDMFHSFRGYDEVNKLAFFLQRLRVRIPTKPRKHFWGLICDCLNRNHYCDDHIFISLITVILTNFYLLIISHYWSLVWVKFGWTPFRVL